MSEKTRNLQWPPAQFAVFQDGDDSPSYYRPREATEELDAFIERIAILWSWALLALEVRLLSRL
jgi:hypothetical protein